MLSKINYLIEYLNLEISHLMDKFFRLDSSLVLKS